MALFRVPREFTRVQELGEPVGTPGTGVNCFVMRVLASCAQCSRGVCALAITQSGTETSPAPAAVITSQSPGTRLAGAQAGAPVVLSPALSPSLSRPLTTVPRLGRSTGRRRRRRCWGPCAWALVTRPSSATTAAQLMGARGCGACVHQACAQCVEPSLSTQTGSHSVDSVGEPGGLCLMAPQQPRDVLYVRVGHDVHTAAASALAPSVTCACLCVLR
jgi:hypothetical protein